MIKALFFDIDGTLLSFKTHKMPESTKQALATLREKGILTIVSSGRPTYQLPPCIKTGFDAYITLSGQLCYDADGVFRSSPISKTGVASVVEQVKSGCYEALVLQGDRAFCSKLTDDVAERADLPIRRVLSALTVLEIDGYATQHGARRFVRTVEIRL